MQQHPDSGYNIAAHTQRTDTLEIASPHLADYDGFAIPKAASGRSGRRIGHPGWAMAEEKKEEFTGLMVT